MPSAKPAPDTPADIATLSFEDALSELDAIVKRLEGGQAKLEQAISEYERGAALRAHCERKLAEAELKLQAIVTAANGAPKGLRDVE
jgi:exodeoxyribonuclease VII small subunit